MKIQAIDQMSINVAHSEPPAVSFNKTNSKDIEFTIWSILLTHSYDVIV